MISSSGVLLVGNFLSGTHAVRGPCEDLAERLAASGVKVLGTSDKSPRFLRLLDMLRTVHARQDDYSVAHVDVFSGRAFFWAEAVCWLLRRIHKPHVVTLHGGDLLAFARRWPNRVKRLLGAAAAVTTPSAYLLEAMRPYRDDVRLVPNALQVDNYPYRLRDRPRPRLLWLRAFHQIYNPHLAIEVVASLLPRYPNLHLTMVGPDKGDGSLSETKSLLNDLDCADRVQFAGGVPKCDVPEWVSQADIFLNTSSIDNTPVSVLEPMACGLCVVSTNVGGIPYLLEDETDALLAPPGDPQSMAEAVHRLLTEPGLAARLSQNARTKAEQFDWSRTLPQWRALFSSVARGTAH